MSTPTGGAPTLVVCHVVAAAAIGISPTVYNHRRKRILRHGPVAQAALQQGELPVYAAFRARHPPPLDQDSVTAPQYWDIGLRHEDGRS